MFKASANSSKTLASTEPEGKAAELDHPWLFTASMVGFVCFRRMNSDSTPMRKERLSSFLAFLEGMFFLVSRRRKRGGGRKVRTPRLNEGSYEDRDRPRMLVVRSVLEAAFSPETNP